MTAVSTDDLHAARLFDDFRATPEAALRYVPAAESGGVSVMYVLDAVNSNHDELIRSQLALENLLKAEKQPVPQTASIVVLTDLAPRLNGKPTGAEVVPIRQGELFAFHIPASSDGTALAKALGAFQPALTRVQDSGGGDAQVERVALSLQALGFLAAQEAQQPGAKLVIWISPGWPLLEQTHGEHHEQQLFSTVVYFNEALRRARVVLDAVNSAGANTGASGQAYDDGQAAIYTALQARQPGPESGIGTAGHSIGGGTEQGDRYFLNFISPVKDSVHAHPGNISLGALALGSGGQALDHSNDLLQQLQRATADAARIETFVYTPEANEAKPQTLHTLELKVPHAEAHTRNGFYTP